MKRQQTAFLNIDQDHTLSTEQLTAETGTYALICFLAQVRTIQVGKLGRFQFQRGYYLYIGSAFGPGGIKARVHRHLKKHKKQRWHIDYLRKHAHLDQVWYSKNPTRQECQWSQHFESIPCFSSPVPRFGSSDCHCRSHLFYCQKSPDLSVFPAKANSIKSAVHNRR